MLCWTDFIRIANIVHCIVRRNVPNTFPRCWCYKIYLQGMLVWLAVLDTGDRFEESTDYLNTTAVIANWTNSQHREYRLPISLSPEHATSVMYCGFSRQTSSGKLHLETTTIFNFDHQIAKLRGICHLANRPNRSIKALFTYPGLGKVSKCRRFSTF